jgi:hypothetical protein
LRKIAPEWDKTAFADPYTKCGGEIPSLTTHLSLLAQLPTTGSCASLFGFSEFCPTFNEDVMTDVYNALPRLSAESRIADLAYELKISNATCAALINLNPSTLSNALRGVRPLDSETASELLRTLTFLMQCNEAARPLQIIPMSNAAETRRVLDLLREAEVTPDKIRELVSKLLSE